MIHKYLKYLSIEHLRALTAHHLLNLDLLQAKSLLILVTHILKTRNVLENIMLALNMPQSNQFLLPVLVIIAQLTSTLKHRLLTRTENEIVYTQSYHDQRNLLKYYHRKNTLELVLNVTRPNSNPRQHETNVVKSYSTHHRKHMLLLVRRKS